MTSKTLFFETLCIDADHN